MRCFRGKENAACFQRGARGWPKNHEVKQQVYKKENKVFSCDCHPVQMLMPLQRILFSTQSHLNFSTIHRSYNYMFLDAHSPNYPALRHLWFVMKTLCNGNLWFVIFQDQPGGICNLWLLFVMQGTRRPDVLMTPPFHPDPVLKKPSRWLQSRRFRILSEPSRIQRKRRSVTVCNVEFRCTLNQNK